MFYPFYDYSIIALSFWISSSYCLSRASFGSWLTRGLFLIFLALDAYLRVVKVSSKLKSAGEIAAIITVLVLPPRESYSNLVSLESLYGICLDFPSTKEDITLPKAVKERLILIPSFNVYPVAPVLLDLSDPAKSTKFNFPALILYSPSISSAVSI